MSTTQPIRSKRQVNELCDYFLVRGQLRNYVLVVMSLHTALRISDLLRLTWDDVYDFKKKRIRESITITEKKTHKSKIIKLNDKIIAALRKYLFAAKPGEPIFANARTGKAIGRIQAYRIISAAAEKLTFQTRVSCHSLRKTFGYFAWKSGVPVPIIMSIYNHSSYEITRRYADVIIGTSQERLENTGFSRSIPIVLTLCRI